jgi:hypothetical protein
MLTRTSLTNAARWIETHPLYGFGAFATLHFSIWTILPALLYPNLPLDVIEGLVYGREWQLGYDKLPPLPWWLLEMARLAAEHDVAYYLLAQVATITSFVFVFATTLPLVGPFGAFLSILIIDGVQYFISRPSSSITMSSSCRSGRSPASHFTPPCVAVETLTGSCSAWQSEWRFGPNISWSCSHCRSSFFF